MPRLSGSARRDACLPSAMFIPMRVKLNQLEKQVSYVVPAR